MIRAVCSRGAAITRLALGVRTYWNAIYFLETFVDPARFRGTCYRAANWVVLGQTTGRGHNAPSHRRTQPVKDVLGYPLTPRSRERLTDG